MISTALFVTHLNIQSKQSSFTCRGCLSWKSKAIFQYCLFRRSFIGKRNKSLSLFSVQTGWNRRVLLQTVACLCTLPFFHSCLVHSASNDEVVLPDGVRFWLVKRGTGKVHPALGDLVGIRFRAKYGDYVFDDIMESEQPYYLRIGSNIVIQGVEEVLPLMNVGDLVHIVVPSNAAFGSKGRRASPGKRAIPPNATIEYDLELAELPGKEDFTPEVLDSP
ncbi:peptidylprolyl isomerase [Galdieria sulphuraria]|uniref:peptidylprolyl isomerase n=1 Tax=Galdieria sulphuraria TaxID=130081 RepID=M2Y5H2_GALSU|nr:peptidylprolyl isomerase [Galdieria sulphuraria]EME31213.1 peptidylprolyl isomerase [Galdieria sulphuraria]|eukprot:XP_005707733.1 peptidylprolyl isomerase [Galdieria sulphuraria]